MTALGGQELADRMARIEIKLDVILLQMGPVVVDHESRLQKLERMIWIVAGTAIAGGGTIGTLAAYLQGV